MARLILATADGQQVVELRPVNSLGRHPNNSIQLLDKIVSKEHCTIEQRGEAFVLRDAGSLNGTYINGERVKGEQLLRHGDEISLGSTRARFDDGSGPLPPGGRPGPGLRPPLPADPPARGAPPYRQPAPPVVATPPPLEPLPPPSAGRQGPAVTRIEVQAQERAIGTQIAAVQKGFLPYEDVASNAAQLRDDYERLRLSYELSREVALERNLEKMLEKILASMFKFTRADRGVIFLKDRDGELHGMLSRRRDGSDTPITVSSTIMSHVMRERAAVLTHDAAMDFAAAKGKSMILNRISSAIVVPLLHNDEVLGILWLDSETLAQFTPKDLELVAAVSHQAAMFIEINILGRKIEDEIVNRERLSRLLSPNIAQRIISGELNIEKGGSLVKECTVFNSDIRGFTRMSEGTPAPVVVEMLNDYFEVMVESIFKFEGTLDKFMGDGIMALWGAPVAHPDDAVRCVRCALEQMEVLGRFNRRRLEEDEPPIAIGIGVHTGELVAGYVGSSRALSYTVIGDTANTSARLCNIAQAGQVIVSETTHGRLGGKFEVEELPSALLKGKERPLRIFNVLRERPMVQVPAGAPASSG
ncbi:MAG TPA: adenylate/guanylate cyclase domain-containing protein [Polyangiaceae bacterium]|nr:adenylate/guanylate cyclase domain-containing protein [Polyangiaceae bacterium]